MPASRVGEFDAQVGAVCHALARNDHLNTDRKPAVWRSVRHHASSGRPSVRTVQKLWDANFLFAVDECDDHGCAAQIPAPPDVALPADAAKTASGLASIR